MQKILFYQKRKPKTADGLWMHKDSEGNMKIDYVGNNKVYPVTSGENSGGTSAGIYKPLLSISIAEQSAWPHTDPGEFYGEQLTAQVAAALLGMTEEAFSNMFTVGAPVYLKPLDSEDYYNLVALEPDYEGPNDVVADIMLRYVQSTNSITLLYIGGLYTVYYSFSSTPK